MDGWNMDEGSTGSGGGGWDGKRGGGMGKERGRS